MYAWCPRAECAEATIGRGDHVLPPDDLRVPHNALRHQVRMLDKGGYRIDDTRDENLALGQFHLLPDLPFVRMAWVGGLDRIRLRPNGKHDIEDAF